MIPLCDYNSCIVRMRIISPRGAQNASALAENEKLFAFFPLTRPLPPPTTWQNRSQHAVFKFDFYVNKNHSGWKVRMRMISARFVSRMIFNLLILKLFSEMFQK
ncbi:hypothetical protein [Shewanella cyperi]|uniref:hypothetical protein n=1 Tax=Shewanella cyperi TaxID=2814292 RepID=UPI001A953FA1|nr:hypothetical protein [Shewanella cyperi]QSX41872.1 hypothetical protein JYB84_05505 [Shewanella cyperi]